MERRTVLVGNGKRGKGERLSRRDWFYDYISNLIPGILIDSVEPERIPNILIGANGCKYNLALIELGVDSSNFQGPGYDRVKFPHGFPTGLNTLKSFKEASPETKIYMYTERGAQHLDLAKEYGAEGIIEITSRNLNQNLITILVK